MKKNFPNNIVIRFDKLRNCGILVVIEMRDFMTLYETCINCTIDQLFTIWSTRGTYTEEQQRSLYQILKETRLFLLHHRDHTLEELVFIQNKPLQETIATLMEEKKTAGLAFGYQLMEGPQLEFYRGKISLDQHSPYIDAHTKFQAASITKEIVAFLLATLEQQGLLNFSTKVNELGKGFDAIDATILQLMNGNVVVSSGLKEDETFTEKRVNQCTSYQEGLEVLKQAIITKRDTYLYQDNPWMILRELIDHYPEKMQTFLRTCEMKDTGYELQDTDVATGGVYPNIRLDQDRKAQIMKQPGHCGLYVTLPDLLTLSSKLYRYQLVSKTNVERYVTPALKGDWILDANEKECANHRSVLNRKHVSGLNNGEVHPLASNLAMAKDGFTGTYHVTDIPNGYGLAILTNPLSSHEDGKKPPRYPWTLDTLKEEGTKTIFQLKLIQKVYEDYYGYEESKEVQKTYQL